MQGWFYILIMIAMGAGFALVSVVLSNLLGPRHPTAEKSAPYECGMPPVGDARERQRTEPGRERRRQRSGEDYDRAQRGTPFVCAATILTSTAT